MVSSRIYSERNIAIQVEAMVMLFTYGSISNSDINSSRNFIQPEMCTKNKIRTNSPKPHETIPNTARYIPDMKKVESDDDTTVQLSRPGRFGEETGVKLQTRLSFLRQMSSTFWIGSKESGNTCLQRDIFISAPLGRLKNTAVRYYPQCAFANWRRSTVIHFYPC